MLTKAKIQEALGEIENASGKGLLIQANGLRNIQILGNEVVVDVICDSPVLHQKKKFEVSILQAIHAKVDVKLQVKINLIIEAPEKPVKDQIKGKPIPGVQHVIAVASGKGGVGKSTVTANAAVTLSKMGFKVGILDADIYGPSMPLMMDLVSDRPGGIEVDGVRKMEPVESYGVKVMSIGFFAGTDQAVVWRGPMATKALNQMISETFWGDLDFLLIDLPPGTGDIHLSMVQALPITGAIVVSTPQPIALADARKGVGMFQMEAINVPVLGIIENMSYFAPDELPENKYYLFGKEGAQDLANEIQVPFLGELPIVQSIREASDVGHPAALQLDGEVPLAFEKIIQNMMISLAKRVENLPPSEAVRITTMAGCQTSKREV
jgi:ATP-binding protein involved in chromosome partitioning|tara:strand:- start:217 stop:1356 length:1140 start_codon:yes stop_codon:yes gene_type:complete